MTRRKGGETAPHASMASHRETLEETTHEEQTNEQQEKEIIIYWLRRRNITQSRASKRLSIHKKLKKSEVGERRKQSLEEEADVKVSSKKIPKKDSGSKDTEKPKNVKKDNPAKASEVSSSTASKSGVNSLAKPKKQKLVKNRKKEETEFLRGSASTERQPTKSPAKASEKKAISPANVIRQWPFQPTIDEIREAAVDIVKNADDNAAILDIIDSIGAHFYVDLTPREKEVGRIVMDTIAALEEEHEPDDLFDEEEEYYDSEADDVW